MWRRLCAAVGVISVGVLAQLGSDVGAWPAVRVGEIEDAVPAAAFGVASLAAGLLLYQGLIRWNRYRGVVADPGDWLNGVGAVLVIVAGANLAVLVTDSGLATLPWWMLQNALMQLAASIVLLGTTGTVASLGGLERDIRVWGVGAAIAVVGVAETVSVLTDVGQQSGRWPVAGWIVAGGLLAWCALTPPTLSNPRPATTQAITVGAMIVLVAGIAILVLNTARLELWGPGGVGHGPGSAEYAPVLCGGLAIVTVSIRLGYMIHDLALLAQTTHEARTDELTGVANRRALMARLADMVGSPLSLLMLDLDQFKDVNDHYGHDVGDALLRVVTEQFAAMVPAGGLLARLGGDEFAIVLPDDEFRAVRLAHSLTSAAARIADIGGHPVHVGVSVGVAAGGTGIDSEELLRRADAAMYRAKALGSSVVRYEEELDRTARERATRVEELRSALDPDHPLRRQQFEVHYQPQLSFRTGDVSGVEALVRWRHPDHGLLAPAAFIDLVEQYGLMPRLTEHVLWLAASQAARWHGDGRQLRVAVNLSTSVLTDPSLLALLDEVLAVTGIEPGLLVLEVTETTLMVDANRGLLAAHAISSRGVGLSLDDYGTGYSSLSYLNDLPATELKIDQSFVAQLLSDERTAAIVAATVQLAHHLGLRIVAEGVEDEGTLNALRELGCDESQGYFHCRPQPVDELESWFTRQAKANSGGKTMTTTAAQSPYTGR